MEKEKLTFSLPYYDVINVEAKLHLTNSNLSSANAVLMHAPLANIRFDCLLLCLIKASVIIGYSARIPSLNWQLSKPTIQFDT